MRYPNSSASRLVLLLAVLMLLALLAAGCADESGGDADRVIVSGTGAEPPIVPPGTTEDVPQTDPSSGLDMEIACNPIGTELQPDATIEVTLRDGDIELNSDEVQAGTVRFEVENAGSEPHELLIVFSVPPDEMVLEDEGGVDESALPEGTVVGNITTFPAGVACPGVFELAAGAYTLVCNLVEPGEGANKSHFASGEVARLTATGL